MGKPEPRSDIEFPLNTPYLHDLPRFCWEYFGKSGYTISRVHDIVH